ncbi:MAG: DUF2249 domain-containing protein [Actinomycetaceae bacterium]|nr:DUF2249 domain-containing protein [Actinomycetaceae bacterium]
MGCCSSHTSVALPELDAQDIPPIIRHGAIIGAIDALRPGTSFALIAPHDPVPLLSQIHKQFGESVSISYLETGPDWKLRVTAH